MIEIATLPFDAEAWAQDVYATLLTAHRVLLQADDVDALTAWRWWDTMVDHADTRAGSRPPQTPEEVTEALKSFSLTCAEEFGWRERREVEKEREDAAALEARLEAVADRDAEEEAQAKRAGSWGAW